MDEQLGKLFDFRPERPEARWEHADSGLLRQRSGKRRCGVSGPFRGIQDAPVRGRDPFLSFSVAWGPGLIPSNKNEDTREGEPEIGLLRGGLGSHSCSIWLTSSHPQGVKYDGESLPDAFARQKRRLPPAGPLFFRRPPDRDSFYGVRDLARPGGSLGQMEIALRV